MSSRLIDLGQHQAAIQRVELAVELVAIGDHHDVTNSKRPNWGTALSVAADAAHNAA